MFRETFTVDQAVEELRQRAPAFIAKSDRKALEHMYADLVARACVSNPDEELEIHTHMRMAYRELILAGSEDIRRDIFNDL